MDAGMAVGFIGPGIMGTPTAGRLLDAGHRLHVSVRRAVSVRRRTADADDTLRAA